MSLAGAELVLLAQQELSYSSNFGECDVKAVITMKTKQNNLPHAQVVFFLSPVSSKKWEEESVGGLN